MRIMGFILFATIFMCGCDDTGNKANMIKDNSASALVEKVEVKTEDLIVNTTQEVVSEKEKRPIQVPVATVTSNQEGENAVEENSWGFSVYDPQSGIIEYYSSSGMFLGKRQK